MSLPIVLLCVIFFDDFDAAAAAEMMNKVYACKQLIYPSFNFFLYPFGNNMQRSFRPCKIENINK